MGTRGDLAVFCRQATALPDDGAQLYIRIRQREGRSWRNVASSIQPGDDPAQLERALRERLQNLDPGPTRIELLEVGGQAPRETCRWDVDGERDDDDQDRTLAQAAVGILTEARHLIRDQADRASDAQRQAREATERAHAYAMQALQLVLEHQGPIKLLETTIERIGPSLIPALLGRREQLAAAKRGAVAGVVDWRGRVLEALDTLGQALEQAPELAQDPEILARLGALGDRVGELLTSSPPD